VSKEAHITGVSTSGAEAEAPSAVPAHFIEQVMARLLEHALPITYRVATSSVEKEITYSLRYDAIMARGWGRPEDFPGGLEHDSYDEHAVHIIGWHGDIPVATGRIVFPESGRLLPTEEAFGIVVEPRGRYTDASRGVVVREYSDMRHAALLGMMARCWYAIHERGYDDSCVGAATPAMVRLYRRMGFPVRVLGPSRRYWAEERFPILIDTPGVCRVLARRWGYPAIEASG
jgi:N-acyl-L-homoserine lactone synthetase